MAKESRDLTPKYTVPGIEREAAGRLIGLLRMRLHALNDLHLTLKHVHWNVVGPHFIAVHQMIDPQVDRVRDMADDVAERLAALGGVAQGTPGALVSERSWDDYAIGRADALAHLAALDVVYTGLIEDVRTSIKEAGQVDPATEDLLIEQLRDLEQFQWFLRAHLENASGTLATDTARFEEEAAAKGARLGQGRHPVPRAGAAAGRGHAAR
ncbi:Dps family protein [Streptomyces sp. NPDC101149]|uniref:Dps family protein n=1 Tax=Streptomyces sp. NPDC101149 TaxID=3366113 RepID=UPI0037F3702E